MSNTPKVILYIVIIIACGALISAGVTVILNSYDMYNESKMIAESLITKNPVFQGTPNYTIVQQGFTQALYYFTLALGFLISGLLLPRIQNVSISPTGGITLSLIQQNLDAIIKQQNSLQSSSVGEGGMEPARVMMQGEKEIINGNFKGNTDTQKGRWGKEPAKNDRRLSARIEESEISNLFKVTLKLESTNVAKPLEGVVKFYLHHSFHNANPIIAVEDGNAVLKLNKVIGAFTVGAEAGNGNTHLELDLATLEDVPADFK